MRPAHAALLVQRGLLGPGPPLGLRGGAWGGSLLGLGGHLALLGGLAMLLLLLLLLPLLLLLH